MYTFGMIRSAILEAEGNSAILPEARSLDAWRSIRGQAYMQKLLKEIRESADRAREEPIIALPFDSFHKFEAIGTRLEYERPYFRRRERLLALTLATLMDETDDYLPALENLIWDICSEYTWCVPAHLPHSLEQVKSGRIPPESIVDLFAAETSHALAECITLLAGRLNPWIEYRVRSEVERRVLQPIFHHPSHFHWESSTANWSSVCAGAAGMAAMLLVEDRERLAGMIDRVIRAMECFLQGYGEDGCCQEGITYWTYGFGYYVYFCDMLDEYTGGALNLLQGDKIRSIASFPAYASLGSQKFINYSDAPEQHHLHTGLLSRLHSRLQQPLPQMNQLAPFHTDGCYRWPHVVRSLLWTRPELLEEPVPAGTHLFADAGWMVNRQVTDAGVYAFSAKGGHNDEPHNHNDLGHFLVHIAGETLLADLGMGLYTKEYFGPNRYSLTHNSSEGHSVPVINGHCQGTGRRYEAVIASYEGHIHTASIELDLTRAYPDEAGLSRIQRAFRWSSNSDNDQQAALHLIDTFEFEADNNTVEELFISLHCPVIDHSSITWIGEKGYITLRCQGAGSAVVEQLAERTHKDEPLTVYRTRIKLDGLPRAAQVEMTFTAAVKEK
ncbi:hypothetical protein ACFO9Q_15760 [Paenibacillus sp. GCM10023252]|uniref:hypothetical protein n=1 Tax=Paenibacillus sp. GCM10023252 TaxID=3252649 RepID=UPI0036191E9A